MGLTFTSLVVALFALSAIALTRVKREFARQRTLSTTSGVLVWLVYLWLTGLVALFAWHALWRLNIVPSVLNVLGGIVALLGLLLFAFAVYQFRSLARISGQKEDELINGGVYRYSRNPQNVGWLLFLVGVGLLGQSSAALLLTFVFWLILHAYLVTAEEPHLMRVFGERYRRYMRTTPRYLSAVRPASSG